MTAGARDRIADDEEAAKWAVKALCLINRKGSEPSMVVGRATDCESLEDEGRTLVLPLGGGKMYACLNETGGVTLMLADEY